MKKNNNVVNGPSYNNKFPSNKNVTIIHSKNCGMFK